MTVRTKKTRTNHLELARSILDFAQESGLSAGDALPELALARQFEVSRTLIRSALQVLQEQQLAQHESGRGFFLTRDPASPELAPSLPQAAEEQAAASILRDRMAGRLGNSISISELMRRYELSRADAQKVLGQLSEDQVIERGAGQSWHFRPLLNNLAALEDSLRLRLILEPEALLAPGFAPDRQRLSLLRSGMEQLLASPIEQFDISQFRELDIAFHELIAHSCGNRFIADILLQHQKLRRLPNLLPMVSPFRLQEALREHLRILEQIERGQLDIAADLMRLHLRLSAAQRPQTANRGIPQGPRSGGR